MERYEAYRSGEISREDFIIIKESLTVQADELSAKKNSLKVNTVICSKLKKKKLKLTAEILHIFIKRAEIGERAEKYSRTAPQEIRIFYRDIGLVNELPQSMAGAVVEAIS